MTPQERQEVLGALRAGASPEEAAQLVGRTPRSLQAASVRDGELRAAMDGEPLEQQHLAHRGDFIAAMIRHGGNQKEACREIGEPPGAAHQWGKSDPQFAALVTSVLDWIGAAGLATPRVKVTQAALDRAADLLTDGHTPDDVAAQVGLSLVTLKKRAASHEALRRALDSARTPRRPVPIESDAAKWATRSKPVRIAEATRLIQGGATYTSAAAAVGLNIWALYKARDRFPELAAAMSAKRPPKRQGGEAPPRRKRKRAPDATPEADEQLREEWGNLDLTLHDLAKRFGVHVTTLSRRARRLELPDRNDLRRSPDA